MCPGLQLRLHYRWVDLVCSQSHSRGEGIDERLPFCPEIYIVPGGVWRAVGGDARVIEPTAGTFEPASPHFFGLFAGRLPFSLAITKCSYQGVHKQERRAVKLSDRRRSAEPSILLLIKCRADQGNGVQSNKHKLRDRVKGLVKTEIDHYGIKVRSLFCFG